jgi:hypothetical protein
MFSPKKQSKTMILGGGGGGEVVISGSNVKICSFLLPMGLGKYKRNLYNH